MNLNFESDRLLFRPLEMGDLDLIVAQWSDPDVIRYLDDQTYNRNEVAEMIPKFTRRCGGGCIGVWSLTEKDTGDQIGTAALLPLPVELDDTDWDLLLGEDVPEGDIEIGYILKKSAWGQGYATEACKRTLRFAFEETPLTEVMATIDPDNEASRHVLMKSGMSSIGMVLAYAEDSPGFRLTREEWQASQKN